MSQQPGSSSHEPAASTAYLLQVRVSTDLGGLKAFHLSKEEAAQVPWQSWRHMSLASDQGADMLSSTHALQFLEEIKCNVTPYYDPSHGSNRDFWLAVGEMQLKNFMLLAMIAINLPHGPDETDLRFNQVRQTMTRYYSSTTPALSPIFQRLAGHMIKEKGDAVEPQHGESIEAALWRHLEQETYYKKKGYKTNKGRFHAVVHDGLELLSRWHCTLFEVTVPCIELDMIQTAALPKIKLALAGADVASNQESTSSKLVSAADRSLRSCGANAMVISLALLSDPSNRRILAIACCLAKPTMSWHGHASRELRDVKRSQAWLLEQVRGGAAMAAFEVFGVLKCADFLTVSGFLPISDGAFADWERHEIASEDEFAELAGGFALSMLKYRLRRTLFQVASWPYRLVLLLGTDLEAEAVLREFRAAFELHEAFKGIADRTALMASYISRSPFQTLSVQQAVLACKESGFTACAALRAFMDERTKTVMQSQGVEDMNNYQKNAHQVRNWGSRYRRPQTCLAVTARMNLLSSVHRFDTVKWQGPHDVKPTPLVKEDLAPLGNPSLPFGKVATHSDRAPYFSPQAEGVSIGVADQAVLNELRERGRLSDVADAWKGFFCNSSHQVAFRRKGGDHGAEMAGQWFVGLWHFKDSGCFACVVNAVKVAAGQELWYLEFEQQTSATMLGIVSLDDWECFGFSWRSWAWQVKNIPSASSILRPAVRAFKENDTTTVLKLAAAKAWWSLSRSTLDSLAEHLSVGLSSTPNTFEVLFALTKHVLKVGDERCCEILKMRLSKLIASSRNTAEILAVDEAAQCLREEDRQDVKDQQKHTLEHEAEIASFRDRFREKRAAVRLAAGGGKASSKKVAWKGPKKIGGMEQIKQSDAKKFLPPNSYLWRSRGSGSWNSRHSDLPTRSCRDSAWGSEERAILECLRYAWDCYLDLTGFRREDCPIGDLWTVGYSSLASGSSSSSTAAV